MFMKAKEPPPGRGGFEEVVLTHSQVMKKVFAFPQLLEGKRAAEQLEASIALRSKRTQVT